MVTLKDIAEKAGVSSMTVSRVMNGKTGTVSQQTSERIKKIAQEMGYVPNSSARALASRSSRLIAALLQEYDEGEKSSGRQLYKLFPRGIRPPDQEGRI